MSLRKGSKNLQAKMENAKKGIHQLVFEVTGTYNPKGTSNFLGSVKDEKGKVLLLIKEDEDYNQLTRLLNTSKYMNKLEDMRGLAEYVYDRNLITMDEEEKEEWRKKKRNPVEITLKRI
jgi:hypothetical protein